MRFRGEHNQRVDDKCRMSIPSSFRALMDASGETSLVLVRAMRARCLQAYTVRDWEAREDQVMKLAPSNPAVQNVLRFQFASAQTVTPDSHGRVLLSPELRQYADLTPTQDVKVVGLVHRFEIWSRAAWDAEQARLEGSMETWEADVAALGL